jgi:hypothetical protein
LDPGYKAHNSRGADSTIVRYGAPEKYGAWYGAQRDWGWLSVVGRGLRYEKTLENQGFQRVSVPPQGVEHILKTLSFVIGFVPWYGAWYGRNSQVLYLALQRL